MDSHGIEIEPGWAEEGFDTWVEWAARVGYAAKGVVYAVIGVLAVGQAFGSWGDASGSHGALRTIASGPFGQVLIGAMALGLVGHVAWRMVQSFLDPEGKRKDGGMKRIATRLFYFLSAVVYGALAYYAIQLLLGSGGGSGGGAGGGGAGGSGQGRVAGLMSRPWGVWLVGLVGVGIIARGMVQLVKAYTESFRDKITSFQLGPARSDWVLKASRIGLTARGVVFGIIGGYAVYAAVTHDPAQTRGLEGALQTMRDQPWLLGAVGAGLVCYALYQWVKARYRLIGAG